MEQGPEAIRMDQDRRRDPRDPRRILRTNYWVRTPTGDRPARGSADPDVEVHREDGLAVIPDRMPQPPHTEVPSRPSAQAAPEVEGGAASRRDVPVDDPDRSQLHHRTHPVPDLDSLSLS